MKIEDMKAKDLRIWIDNLVNSIKTETDDKNIALYSKWLQEARNEQEQRFNYLSNRGEL